MLVGQPGDRLTSEDCIMPLAIAERRLCVAERLACMILDRLDPTRVAHTLAV